MPLCHLFTNVAAAALKEGIESRLAHTIAATLKKPLERVAVVVIPGVLLFKNGSSEPACTVNLSSIGVFSKEKNPTYTEPLMEAIVKELDIPRERVALVYDDLNPDMLAKSS